MNTLDTLTDLLKERAKSESVGITFINGIDKESVNYISYQDMYFNALKRLGYLQKKGLKKGTYAIFQLDDNEEFITTFWACILGNIIPIPIAVGLNEAKSLKFFNILNIIQDALVITNYETKRKLIALDHDFYGSINADRLERITLCVEEMRSYDEFGDIVTVKPDELAFVQFSSGSTGNPKGIKLTHENLLTNLYDIQQKAYIDENDKVLSWLPLTHDMGIIGFHLVPTLVGINNYLIPTNLFARNPIIWINAVDEYRATLISSPNFGYKLFMRYYENAIKKKKEFKWDLSSVRLIFNGAEPISVEISIKFMEVLKKYHLKENSMYFVYGMAEACLGVTFPEPGDKYNYYAINIHSLTIGNKVELVDIKNNSNNTLLLADCGKPLKNLEIKIVDKEGNLLEDGYVGRIHIKGKNVTKGYYNAEEYTKTVIDEQGWLNTGDIGVIIDSRLLITGREKDIIIVNGINYYATDIEEICEKGLNIKPGGVVACSLKDISNNEDVLVLFIHDTFNKIDAFREKIDVIHSYLSRTLGLDAKYILPIKQVPKTTSGKVQHYKLVEEYNRHEFDNLINELYGKKNEKQSEQITKEINNTENIIKDIVCDVLEINNIKFDANLVDYCGSSLKVMEIQERINQKYKNGLQISDIYECTSIKDIANLLKRRNELIEDNGHDFEKNENNYTNGRKIAITGINVNLPGVNTLEDLRDAFLGNGILKRELSDIRKKDIQTIFDDLDEEDFEPGFFLDRIDTFDWEFFNITPNEAELLSPVQRLFLQSAYKAIQDAGYTEKRISNTQTGVFVGYISDLDNYKYKEYIYQNGNNDEKEISVAGNLSSIISGRLSHYLNLHGPSMMIDTACSSSLSALYMACQSINQGDCTAALVGGIRINICPIKTDARLGIESEKGILRAFDDQADGTVEGEGCITLFLKEYAEAKKDNDPIYAVILSGAINHDGKSASITSPSAEAQSNVLIKAWERSGINPEQIGCIEAHGTGTKVGDIIELEGISKAFSKFTNRKQFCAISASKSVFGHTYDLAGMLGVLRMILQLKYKELYGIPNLSTPNTKFEFHNSPVWLNEKYQKWESEQLRIGGVSSFGFSGTNCHIVLAEEAEEYENINSNESQNMLVITAKSKDSLLSLLYEYQETLSAIDRNKYNSFCYSVNNYRDFFKEYMVIILAEDFDDMINKLKCSQSELKSDLFICKNIYYKIKEQSFGNMDKQHPYYECIDKITKLSTDFMPKKIESFERIHIPTYPFKQSRVWYFTQKLQKKENNQLMHKIQWNELQNVKTSKYDYVKKYIVLSKNDARYKMLTTEFADATIIFNDELIQEINSYLGNEKIVVYYFAEQIEKGSTELCDIKYFVDTQVRRLTEILRNLNHSSKLTFTLVLQNSVKVFDDDKIIPELSMLAAMIRSVSIEMENIQFKIIDCECNIDNNMISYATNIKNVPWIAIRGKKYYGASLLELRREYTDKKISIQKNGVYLFTGALGAIGITLVSEFIEKYDVNVILIGRKKEIDCKEKLNVFVDHRERISYRCCDVSNEKDVTELYNDCIENNIHVNGIFHLAGLSATGLFMKKSFEVIENNLAPKVYGSCNLINTFGKNKPDFIFLFSSGMVIFPEIGQCEYVMANQYMDAVSEAFEDENVYCVNWPVFNDSGMAEKNGYYNPIFYSINTKDVLSIVEKVLSQNTKHIAIGKWKKENKKNEYLKKYGYIHKSECEEIDNVDSVVGFSRTDILNELCNIINDVTGLQIVDLNENFLEKGVDSILLVRIYKKIESRFPESKISISQMFTLNTIQKLADKLYQDKNMEKDSFEIYIRSLLNKVEEHKLSVEDMTDQLCAY